MVSVDDIKRFLERHGFELLSQPGYEIQIYRKEGILVKIEEKSKKGSL